MHPNPDRLSLSIPEAVQASGLGRTTIYDLIKRGQLPICKVGSRTLIRLEALDGLLRSLETIAKGA